MNAPVFPNSTPSTRFCIVRHGETAWNAEKRIQGQTDVPLNDVGREQALAAARGLEGQKFAALYTSDLQRARDTAAALATGLSLTMLLEPGLRERNYGRFQGLTQQENANLYPEDHARYLARDPYFNFGSGESLRSFATRVVTTLGRLASIHLGENVLAVAHGGVLDVIYRQASGRSLESPRDFPIPNAALNWIEIDVTGKWSLLSWAEQGHLRTTRELVAE